MFDLVHRYWLEFGGFYQPVDKLALLADVGKLKTHQREPFGLSVVSVVHVANIRLLPRFVHELAQRSRAIGKLNHREVRVVEQFNIERNHTKVNHCRAGYVEVIGQVGRGE